MKADTVTVNIEATDILEKDVKDSGESGAIYIPKEYIGRQVFVIIRR